MMCGSFLTTFINWFTAQDLDSTKLKSEHNGGTVFSPTVPFSATTGDYLNGVGETDASGSGCWVGDLSLIKYSNAGVGWNFIQQIRANQRDVNFLVQGDSTGNETYEWVYLTANNLADEFPTHTVNYYLWNVGTVDYDSVEVISTGTGSNVINVYNASVSGSSAVYFDGARKEKCFAGKDFDLIINNYGHNGATAADVAGVADRVLIHTTQLMQEQPKAEIVLTLQNIDTSVEAFSARQVQATDYVADILGLGVIDVRSLFLWAREQGGSLFSSWMGDAVHPSASGQKVWADMVFNMLLNETKQSVSPRIVLNEKLKPVIPNHDFKDWAWDKSIPFGWYVAGATATKDVTDCETGSWSVKLSGTGAGLGTLQTIIDDYLQQRTQGVDLVCMVRVKVSESNGSLNAGRVEVVSSISSKASEVYPESYGGWTWGLITVPAAMVDGSTTLKVNIYAGDNTDEVLVDRVILLEGNVPYDNYSEKTTLSDYYDPANVGTLEGNTMVVTGNTIEVTATTNPFPLFYIDVFNLVPNEKYQFEWTTSTPAGTVLIRDGVGGNGSVIETISPLSTQIAVWTAIRGFCTFEVSESLVSTPFSLDDIKITKV